MDGTSEGQNQAAEAKNDPAGVGLTADAGAGGAEARKAAVNAELAAEIPGEDLVGVDIPGELARERKTIDNIDAALVYILAERFRCTQRVGHIKARYNLPPADPGREERQVKRLRALAEVAGLDPDFAEKFLGFMVREVIRHHVEIKHEYEEQRKND